MEATLSNTSATGAAGAAGSASGKTASKLAQDLQDRFLTLLVTQMKNQDPLNPMDNAALTTQLAQISTVTGVDAMHTSLKTMIEQIRGMEALQAASLNGRNVLVPGERLGLAEGVAVGGFELSGAADDVTIAVRDKNGAIVKEIVMGATPAGLNLFEWDGTTASGAKAADGAYTFAVQARSAGQAIESSALARARVEGIRRGEQGIELDLGPLGRRAFTDVREIL